MNGFLWRQQDDVFQACLTISAGANRFYQFNRTSSVGNAGTVLSSTPRRLAYQKLLFESPRLWHDETWTIPHSHIIPMRNSPSGPAVIY